MTSPNAPLVVGSSHRSRLGRAVAEAVAAGPPGPVAIAPAGYAGGGHRIAVILTSDPRKRSRGELRGTPTRLRERRGRIRLNSMREAQPGEPQLPTTATDQTGEEDPASTRPTVDEMSEWSFPASDPPATWTWDVDRPFRR